MSASSRRSPEPLRETAPRHLRRQPGAAALLAAGHDVEATGDCPKDPGDDEILFYAFKNGRVLVTLDKDFGELAIVHGRSHAGILRLVDVRADLQGLHCANAVAKYGNELAAGAIVTVEPTRVRVRPPDEAS